MFHRVLVVFLAVLCHSDYSSSTVISNCRNEQIAKLTRVKMDNWPPTICLLSKYTEESLAVEMNELCPASLLESMEKLMFGCIQFFRRRNMDETFLHAAAEKGDLETVKFLVEEKKYSPDLQNAMDLQTPLHRAVANGHLHVVKYLASEAKADLHIKAEGDWTLLHSVFPASWELLNEDTINKKLAILKYLIDDMKMFSHIDDTTSNDLTITQQAATFGALPILKYLLDEKHANRTVNSRGQNLLDLARMGDHVEMEKYLVEEKGYVSVEKRNSFFSKIINFLRRTF